MHAYPELTRLCLIAGARPNFMKIAPIIRSLKMRLPPIPYSLIHTGQHYDHDMSAVFFAELGIPEPDEFLGTGGGSHAEQTGRIMMAFEKYCQRARPAIVVVVGDVNSTLACSVVAKKYGAVVAHVEAGLRSGDMSMPEEINRIITDAITDHFFVTEEAAIRNLLAEGKRRERIHFVGQVMVDTLLFQISRLEERQNATPLSKRLKSEMNKFGVITLHRPSNVDDERSLRGLVGALNEIAGELPLVFSVHPRTMENLKRFAIQVVPRIVLTPPLSYMEFLNLWKDAVVVITDSGGLQEETTALGVPCVTVRDNTERPVTVEQGTNFLVGTNPTAVVEAVKKILGGHTKRGRRPPLWDGHAAERIVEVLAGFVT